MHVRSFAKRMNWVEPYLFDFLTHNKFVECKEVTHAIQRLSGLMGAVSSSPDLVRGIK